jgi:hypothetical protein
MQQRIECSGTHAVTVFGKFLDQPETIHRLFRRMMEHVQLYETSRKKI